MATISTPPLNTGAPTLTAQASAVLIDWSSVAHIVQGTVTVEGSAATKRVALIDRMTLEVLQSTWSDAQGDYRFERLQPRHREEGRLLVVALDDSGTYNAEMADHVSAAIPAAGGG